MFRIRGTFYGRTKDGHIVPLSNSMTSEQQERQWDLNKLKEFQTAIKSRAKEEGKNNG